MNRLNLLFLSVISLFSTSVKALEMIPYEELEKYDLTDDKIEKLSKISQDHILKSAKSQITSDEIKLLDVELAIESDGDGDKPTAKNVSQAQPADPPLCVPQKTLDPIQSLNKTMEDVLAHSPPKKKRYIYFTWGYNRGFHSKSDATFTTNSGTFTIHDAIGHDRPSTDLIDYIHPTHIPIPQYNLRVGYELNEHWDIVAGLDHMKWVFQNQYKYEVTGDYNHTVFVPDPSGDPALLQGLTFDQVKETGDMRWLTFDHTNGYNYAHVGGIYKSDLFTSPNGKFKVSTGLGAGAGLMIPQTSVRYHQDGWWNWQSVDNQFHVAGYGGHAEAKLRVGYGNFFMEPVVRGTYIKINNALVQESGEKLEHSPIGSIQFIVQGGYRIPLRERKKKAPQKEL